jgi:hypothetical protein
MPQPTNKINVDYSLFTAEQMEDYYELLLTAPVLSPFITGRLFLKHIPFSKNNRIIGSSQNISGNKWFIMAFTVHQRRGV